ncbi:MAG: radical SAM protein [Myxococcaceae bacterium]|nr:radical SAM protein [Myxococcaceae bacterium]
MQHDWKEARAPDLLFEEEQRARVAEIAPLLEHPEQITARTPLHRITVFLTYRCNLACPYCKTIARSAAELDARPHRRLTYDLASFEALLDAHRETPLRHLHFTGGEATLVPQLAAMIRRAKARGVGAVSLTSNGTLAPRLYVDLVKSGLTELRISIDAGDPALGEAMTGRPGAFDAVMRTLHALAAERARGLRFAWILNTVVSEKNRARLPEILGSLLRFEPDDIKLITSVDLRGRLGDFPEAQAVRQELERMVAALPPEAMPLLRRKLQTVFAPDAIGLDRVRAAPARSWRCYIPLTERTVDRAHYYPCSVYLREGGAPLGPIDDPPHVQRERSARFVRESNCLSDPICRRYCLNCTRAFNERANEARG